MIPNDVLRDLEETWRSRADDAKQSAVSLSGEGQAKAAAQELGRASAYNACAMMLHRLIHANEKEKLQAAAQEAGAPAC